MKPLSCSVCKSGCSIPAACDRLPREVPAPSLSDESLLREALDALEYTEGISWAGGKSVGVSVPQIKRSLANLRQRFGIQA